MTSTTRITTAYRVLLLTLLVALAWVALGQSAPSRVPDAQGPLGHTPSTLEVLAQLRSSTGTQR